MPTSSSEPLCSRKAAIARRLFGDAPRPKAAGSARPAGLQEHVLCAMLFLT